MTVTIDYRNAPDLAPPTGLYSHIARVGDLVFFSGMASLGPDGNVIGKGDFEQQVREVYRQIGKALEGEGLSWSNIAQMTTYLTEERNVPTFYSVRATVFEELYPDKQYPPNATIICRLSDSELLIEVQLIAAA